MTPLKHFLLFILLFCSSHFLILAAPPNFLLLIADDSTYRDHGVYGGQAKTPHLDRLAREGLKFNRCFQAAPMCPPSGAAYALDYPDVNVTKFCGKRS
jgi:N-sulfoglucosamine sulfohydrolase